MTVPTDCDQRDERLGWMGDANLSGDSMALNFDAEAFLRFFVGSVVSEVDADGSLTDTVPFVRYGSRPGDVSWTAALPNLVSVLAGTYGDKTTASTYLDVLVSHVGNIQSQAAKGLSKMHTPYMC